MSQKSKPTGTSKSDESVGQRNAQLLLQPSVNSAAVIQSFAGKMTGGDTDINFLIDGLRDTFSKTKDGELSTLEAMLIGQATALQTMFVSLARRGQAQTSQRNLEAFLNLALKAQTQSRATILAVMELKYPRQVAFVKQTNVSHGPQQINNHVDSDAGSRTEEISAQQNKLLARQSDGSTYLDTRAKKTAGGSHPTLDAMETVDGANQSGRQSESITERLPRRRVAKIT